MSQLGSIVIAGGGAAGVLAAIHLAADPAGRRHVVVVEPAAGLGTGAAYGTGSPSHLLNVRASGMSAYPDVPGHFLEWVRGQGIMADATDFLPRMLYGRYLQDTLGVVSATTTGPTVLHRQGRVRGLSRTSQAGWLVALEDGTELAAEHVVLATGNVAAPAPGPVGHPRFVVDPWAGTGVADLHEAAEILIVGTGLTAIDVLLTLRDMGHRGRIRMISSHGLLPEHHAPGVLPTVSPFAVAGTADGRSVRMALAAARAAASAADDWRQVIDGLRPETIHLWRDLPDVERRRFLRHLGRRWEVCRHRVAPQVGALTSRLQEAGRLTIERGRVMGVEVSGERVRARVVTNGALRSVVADAAIWCAGPSADPRHDPLLAGLIDEGVVLRHPMGLGLAVDGAGRALDPSGAVQQGLWAMGSLRRGAEWESTAVPELRAQASGLAAALG